MQRGILVTNPDHTVYSLQKERKKLSRKAQMQTRRRNGGSNPASSVSPHYKISDLNAATHRLEEGSAPSTPNPKKQKKNGAALIQTSLFGGRINLPKSERRASDRYKTGQGKRLLVLLLFFILLCNHCSRCSHEIHTDLCIQNNVDVRFFPVDK